jgi:prepilin-type N-terminal cleavage/methylation domain-containing protein
MGMNANHVSTNTDNKEVEVPVEKQDKGFTLVELLIVIVILGILATVTVFAVRGITNKGQTNACNTDKVTLQTAVETYFAQYGGSTIASAVFTASAATGNTALATAIAKPTGSVWTPDVVGATPAVSLMNAGIIRAAPTNFFVTPAGTLISLNANCGTVNSVVG